MIEDSLVTQSRGRRTGAFVLSAVALAMLLATACSSSKKSTAPTTSPPATTSAAVTDTSSSAAPASADVTAAVTKAYNTFFDPANPPSVTETVLQDGTAFHDAIVGLSATAKQQKTGITVKGVSLHTPHVAVVTFDILSNGSPVAQNQTGYAILENGAWKVAGGTFCGLISLQGTPPPVCSVAAAVQLPNN